MTQPAAIPENEQERIARLHMLEILDSEPEAIFDSLTRLASEMFDVPIALVSLVDTSRQWIKSNVGLPGCTETPRDIAFCAHAILDTAIMEVENARLDPRFAENPLVTGDPGIKFYAGAPIILSDSTRLGTICIIDRTPRSLSGLQRMMLAELARAVSHAIEARERSVNAHTATLQLQEELGAVARRSHLLRVTMDACPIAVTIADMTRPDAPVFYANPMYATLTGYEADEVVDHPSHYFSGEMIGADVATALRQKIASGQQDVLEIVKHRKDGSAFLSRLTVAPIFGNDGEVTACIGMESDVTVEAHRRDAIEHQREKMAALGRAMGGVAHEINNMLQPVSLLVQDVIDNDLVTPEGTAHLDTVLDCARNARNIIDGVLAFSRPASKSGEVHDFAKLLKEILPIAARGIAKTVELSLCAECPPLLIEMSRTKLTQILVNLVSNAASAMAGKGQLTIELDEDILPSSGVARKAARLRITDDGCGMDATTQDRAFEPFFTTKQIGQGTGLGLPLVYALVQETGGLIKLESKPDLGTTITILIPVTEASQSHIRSGGLA